MNNLTRQMLSVLILGLFATSSWGDNEQSLPPSLDGAIWHGLDFLATQQNPDGSFGSSQKVSVTGLALLSFVSSGQAPNAGKLDATVGKYGMVVRGAIDFLLSQSQSDGAMTRQDKPMCGQAIATFALAESYGIETNELQRKRIALVLTNSVKLILAAQDVKKPEAYAGGWRYEFNSPDSDLAVTGWCALALKSCQDVGINVPRGPIQRAIKFVSRCYNPQSKGFSLQPGTPISPGTTGVGILCLRLLDDGGHGEAIAASGTLATNPLDAESNAPNWGMHAATQAALVMGDSIWKDVSKPVFEKLLSSQQTDGGWPVGSAEVSGAGRGYSTAMAVMTLSMAFRLLPIYQHI